MAPDPEDTRVDRGPDPSAGDGAPRQLGRFETVRLLGRGGMGAVYLAEDRVIGRQVAIKEIRIEKGVSEAARAEQRVRFEVELRATGRLSHPNIATVYDAFETAGSYCIALEYVPGISLDERLKAGPPFAPAEVADLTGQIASGLDYAHRRGIVHRDVKPGNVLLSDEGVVKITDFGIAKLVSLDVTQTGVALGTPAYMSPEQIQGKTLDGPSASSSTRCSRAGCPSTRPMPTRCSTRSCTPSPSGRER
jgi:serine/threonine-protein kinase